MAINRANRGAIFSRLFGNNIQRAREIVAGWLIAAGIGANALTLMGLVPVMIAGVCLAFGAGDRVGNSAIQGHSWYGFWAGIMLILASSFDILDGAVARITKRITKVGGFLDSSIDRIADAIIFTGILAFYINNPPTDGRNVLLGIATIIALANAEIISYVKARAENFIPSCAVGYWQRGERIAAIFIGLFSGHLGTAMIMLAILPAFTVLRRLIFACRQIHRLENAEQLVNPHNPPTGIWRLALWRYKRGSLPYDIVTATNIAMILFIDLR